MRGLILLFALGVLDACYTVYFIEVAQGVELNPAANYFLSLGVPFFLLWKIGLTGICCAVFYFAFQHLKSLWLHLSILGLVLAYSILAAYHIATFLIVCQ